MKNNLSLLAVLPGMWARGAEMCTLNLLRGLSGEGGYDLYFHAALRQALPADMEMHLQPKFESVAQVSYGIHGSIPDVQWNLEQAVIKAKPDILLYAFDASIPGCAPSAKSVLVVHGIAKNDFDGYNQEHTDAVVCVSKCAAEIAEGYGIPRSKIHVIPNGVPQVMASPNQRKKWGIPNDAWVWCFVGGLTRLKRPQLLIAAMARRREAHQNEYALFAGHPDTGMFLEEYAEALGVEDRCIFLGHQDDMGAVYHSADCLVITSERESMPLIILEAMSAGLGVVANNVGGIRETLTNRVGVLCDVEKENDFDDALTEMRCRIKGRAGIAALVVWNDYFSLDIMTRRYDNLFRQLLG